MINRIQAFNNKNNYKQNFGMAVTVADETTRETLNRTAKQWKPRGQRLIRRTIKAIDRARKNDSAVDITFHTLGGLDQVFVDIFSKNTGLKIGSNSVVIYSEKSPRYVRRQLHELNKEAAKLERSLRVADESDDMLAGIPTENCTISRRDCLEVKTFS